MFLIRDILVRIRKRFRILGSVSLTNGSGSRSCSFHQRSSRCQKNIFFALSFHAYFYLKVHLHHSSKIINHKVTKQVFLHFFCLLIEGFGSGSRRPKNIRRIHNNAREICKLCYKLGWALERHILKLFSSSGVFFSLHLSRFFAGFFQVATAGRNTFKV